MACQYVANTVGRLLSIIKGLCQMKRVQFALSKPIRSLPQGLRRGSCRVCLPASLWAFLSSASWAAPFIFNQPPTAKPGDVVSVIGSGFGNAPQVIFKPRHQASAVKVKIVRADATAVAFQVPQNQPFDVYDIAISDGKATSPGVSVNLPQGMYFDQPETAANDKFRIFGRNLYVAPASATVKLVDVASGASLPAAVDLAASDAYSLSVTAPAGLLANHSYRAVVSNGYAAVYSSLCIVGHSPAGVDYFQLGAAWGREYIRQDGPNYHGTADNGDHHIYNVKTDPFLKIRAKGDGIADDRPAIQAAIDAAAAHGGGIVYLPAGTYNLAYIPNSWGLTMRSGVVLQGHGAGDTTILLGPNMQTSSEFYGIGWPANTNLTGLADVAIKNLDTRSQNNTNARADGPTSKIFFQRIKWDLGTGRYLLMNKVDRFVIANSAFNAPINTQQPESPCSMISGAGPVMFGNLTNFAMRNNSFSWATGDITMIVSTNSVIEGNHFTRSATDQVVLTAANNSCLNQNHGVHTYNIGDKVQRSRGRQLKFDFAQLFAIQNNIFDVSDGTLAINHNDGETIMAEGGGGAPKQDVGTVTAAGASTVADNSKSRSWNYGAGYRIAMVSGQGRGQWRNIVSKSGNTFTIDRPWDVVPSAGDHFSIFYPAMQYGLIRNNLLKDNPNGILLYHAGFFNVAIVNNTITDNGGIFLYGIQNPSSGWQPQTGSLRTVEIFGNVLADTKSQWSSYIVADDAIGSPNTIWGTAMDGVQIRNNSIVTRPGQHPAGLFAEGYQSQVFYQYRGAPYSPQDAAPAIVGTIFQGNSCINCPVAYTLSTGVLDTIIWNATPNSSVSPADTGGQRFIVDQKIWNTATQASVGTVVGGD